jgi:hypothetical protein
MGGKKDLEREYSKTFQDWKKVIVEDVRNSMEVGKLPVLACLGRVRDGKSGVMA